MNIPRRLADFSLQGSPANLRGGNRNGRPGERPDDG
jgi:hypothetical protein